MLRLFLFKTSLITGFIILFLITTSIALAVAAPLLPGNILFPVQDFAEQKLIVIFQDPVDRANYALDLLEQRIIDLNDRIGTKYELVALEYLDRAVDQATLAISAVEDGKGGNLRLRLLTLAQQINEKLKLLTVLPTEDESILEAFQAKIQTLLLMVVSNEVKNDELSRITGITAGEPKSKRRSSGSCHSIQRVDPISTRQSWSCTCILSTGWTACFINL